jgi:hypothetical protein
VLVIVFLVYLLLTLPVPANRRVPSTSDKRRVLSLPTVAPATATPGPPLPAEVLFVAEEPIEGFSNCNAYGFRGVIKNSQEDRVAGVQVVVWEDQVGLLALDSTDESGAYVIDIKDKPKDRNLWVQVYRGDLPVSEPITVKTYVDCQNGYQVYRINWLEIKP